MASGPKEETTDETMKLRFLLAERRFLLANLARMQVDLEEHKLVAEALKGVEGSRKCFRKIGGIMCQLTVKEVAPLIQLNVEQLEKYIEDVTKDMVERDHEINVYKQKLGFDFEDRIDEDDLNFENSPTHGVLVGKGF